MTVSKPARRALLLVLAILFAVATVLYSVIWMFARRPFGDIGFRYTYALAKGSLEVSSVEPGSAAEQAGLRAGDRIVSINGQLLDTAVPSYRAFDLGKVGDGLQLTVNRPGTAGPQQSMRSFNRCDSAGMEHLLPLNFWPQGYLICTRFCFWWLVCRCCFCASKIVMPGCWRSCSGGSLRGHLSTKPLSLPSCAGLPSVTG